MKVIKRKELILVLFVYSFGRWLADKHTYMYIDKNLECYKKEDPNRYTLSESELINIIGEFTDEQLSHKYTYLQSISSEMEMIMLDEYPFKFCSRTHVMSSVSLGWNKLSHYYLTKGDKGIDIYSSVGKDKGWLSPFPELCQFRPEIDEEVDYVNLDKNYDPDKKYNFTEHLFSHFWENMKTWSAMSLRLMILEKMG
jgi:hypothetical protein